jgi:hypothetical protein
MIQRRLQCGIKEGFRGVYVWIRGRVQEAIHRKSAGEDTEQCTEENTRQEYSDDTGEGYWGYYRITYKECKRGRCKGEFRKGYREG